MGPAARPRSQRALELLQSFSALATVGNDGYAELVNQLRHVEADAFASATSN